MTRRIALSLSVSFSLLLSTLPTQALARPLTSTDLYKMRSAASVALSPDGTRVIYAVESNGMTGRAYRQLYTAALPRGEGTRLFGETDRAGSAVFSPDGKMFAFSGAVGGKSGLHVANADGTGVRFLAAVEGTNSPLTFEGASLAWSPDSKQIAFVSTVPGPETKDATGDPMVITRYLYKPDAGEGNTRFNDNRRREVFVIDASGGNPRALTSAPREYHSVDWSPDGREILAVSNLDHDPDYFYNQDLVAISVSDGAIRRITATESAEYQPKFSPDGKQIVFLGTRRGLTDLETTMEDTHVWIINTDGTGRRELGAKLDSRQSNATFAPSGGWVYFTALDRGHVLLYRAAVASGDIETVVSAPGSLGGYSVAKNGSLAYTFASPSDQSELFIRETNTPAPAKKGVPAGARIPGLGPARPLTDLNKDALLGVDIAPVQNFTFVSADFKFDIEAFLTLPLGRTADSKHPMIVMIHGGPHGQQGPAFNFKSQFYAGRGYATLQVNFRGSTGYGQKFADGVFADQNGQEGMDVLYGVSAALRRNPWIDPGRLGVEGTSYGGQLSTWLITQSPLFKAAIPTAAITNIISYNYMTYYNQYEEMEWGMRPHQGNLMDVLWERSALKHVAKARAATMMVHGENDNDVPIAEAEQFYIALRDVGVDAILVRYPREGHGIREPKHNVDLMDRSVAWYEKSFSKK
jgi:dipeptidyl aminopeptidase/acylaminoacyl peptidase